jgi:hypothetical protein
MISPTTSNSKTEFAKRIDRAGTLDECQQIKQEIDVLSKYICTKLKKTGATRTRDWIQLQGKRRLRMCLLQLRGSLSKVHGLLPQILSRFVRWVFG